jgi:hypothetical protein
MESLNGEVYFSRTYYTMLGWEPGAFSTAAADWQRLVHTDDLPSMRKTLRLLALGCDVMQGYALARPMAAADLVRGMQAYEPDPGWQPAGGEHRWPDDEPEPSLAG